MKPQTPIATSNKTDTGLMLKTSIQLIYLTTEF